MSSQLPEPWPFDQPPNCAVFTTTHVMRDGKPIVSVFHDEDDHGWQFQSSEPAEMKYALLVALKEIVNHDASVLEVADLPPGWWAHRKSAESEWVRERNASSGTNLLTKPEFHETFSPPMRKVEPDDFPPFELWDYFNRIPASDFEGHQCEEGKVSNVWEDAQKRFQHVLVDTVTPNIFMVLLLDLKDEEVFGHFLLNLNEEYDL